MKRLLFSLVVLSAAAASGQVVQSGTPARIETLNGKVAKAFLQRMDADTLIFQGAKSSTEIPAPASKIKGLTFYPKYDAVAVEHSFNEGEYATVLSTLGPVMEPYWEYMSISNNLHSAFGMLATSHLESGNFSKVKEAGEILLRSSDLDSRLQGQVYVALAALTSVTTNGVVTTNGLLIAEKMRDEVASETAGLYLQACIERAKGESREASKIVAGIIADHGNDLDWMPQCELLSVRLYLDDALTNSAANCARQVQSIYGGSHIARDAEKLRAQLPTKGSSSGDGAAGQDKTKKE